MPRTCPSSGGSRSLWLVSSRWALSLSVLGSQSLPDGVGEDLHAQRSRLTNHSTVLTQGRREEAWKIISRLHDDGTDETQSFAAEEFKQMEGQVELDNIAWTIQGGNKQLFTKPSYRKRMVSQYFSTPLRDCLSRAVAGVLHPIRRTNHRCPGDLRYARCNRLNA
jgi:hypothetical protein